MQLDLTEGLTTRNRKIQVQEVIHLTERDYKIFEFILDMKFASIEDLYLKFFKITYINSEAKSQHWARKRLLQLEKANFLKSVKSFSESTKYYIPTFKSYYSLTNVYPEKEFCKPGFGFDNRTLNHDKCVIKFRVFLENELKVKNWLSDRKLKTFPDLSGGLSHDYIPDATFITTRSKKVALEVEFAAKAKSRYQDKIKRYVQHIRKQDNQTQVFEKVVFVCAKPSVFKIIKNYTSLYSEYFQVFTLEEFLHLKEL